LGVSGISPRRPASILARTPSGRILEGGGVRGRGAGGDGVQGIPRDIGEDEGDHLCRMDQTQKPSPFHAR